MPKVDLQILQAQYTVTCAQGQEQRMRRAAQLLEDGALALLDSGKMHRPQDAITASALQAIFELLEHASPPGQQQQIDQLLLRLEQALERPLP